jgi:hypothetical protein
MTPLDVLWLFFILSSLQPALQQGALALQRARAFLGIPFGGFIDIEDPKA